MIRELPCGCVVENDKYILRVCPSMRKVTRENDKDTCVPAPHVDYIMIRVVYYASHLNMQEGQWLRVARGLLT